MFGCKTSYLMFPDKKKKYFNIVLAPIGQISNLVFGVVVMLSVKSTYIVSVY